MRWQGSGWLWSGCVGNQLTWRLFSLGERQAVREWCEAHALVVGEGGVCRDAWLVLQIGCAPCSRESGMRTHSHTYTKQHTHMYDCAHPCKHAIKPLAAALQASPPSEIVSTNAYMLLYRQRGWLEPPAPQALEELPQGPRQEVHALRDAHEQACSTYTQRSSEVLAAVQQRREVGTHASRRSGWAILEGKTKAAAVGLGCGLVGLSAQ